MKSAQFTDCFITFQKTKYSKIDRSKTTQIKLQTTLLKKSGKQKASY